MPKSPSRRDPPGHPGNVALPWLPAMAPPTLEAALRDADSPKPRFRRDAALALRGADPQRREPARAALYRLLADPEPMVRIHAAESLAVLGDPAAAGPLAALADDPHPDVRTAAVGALADLLPDDPEPLIRLVRHPHEDVRAVVAAELFGREDSGSREALLALLADPAAPVRAAAATAAGSTGRAFTAPLRDRLEDDDPDVRRAAAVALAGLDDPAGRDVLGRRLADGPRDADWTECLAAFAAVAGPDDRDRLSRHAGWTSGRTVRTLALAALARLGDPRALESIRKLAGSGNDRRRAEVLLAAGHARLDALRPEIQAVLEHPGDPAFLAAVRAAVALADEPIRRTIVAVARTVADRSVFEILAGAAAEITTRLGDETPDDLRRLARATFRTDGDPLDGPTAADPDARGEGAPGT